MGGAKQNKMTTTYCVFGEGPNDIGVIDWTTREIKQEGCYSGFFRAAREISHLDCLKAVELKNLKLPGHGRKRPVAKRLKGFTHHSYYAARMAATAGADFLLIGTDVDRGRGSESTHSKRVKSLRQYRKEFEEGFKIACEDNPSVKQIQLVVIVPLCKLETWLLADEKAFFKAAGLKRGELPKQLELMHGQTDAKTFLHSLFKKHEREVPDTKILFNIALKSSPDVLSEMCPVSYKPFLAQCAASRVK